MQLVIAPVVQLLPQNYAAAKAGQAFQKFQNFTTDATGVGAAQITNPNGSGVDVVIDQLQGFSALAAAAFMMVLGGGLATPVQDGSGTNLLSGGAASKATFQHHAAASGASGGTQVDQITLAASVEKIWTPPRTIILPPNSILWVRTNVNSSPTYVWRFFEVPR